ncbi:flagellar export chaperone FliS [Kineococcus arenarius]|uniref:flagellar export chaperone FliS n=1 Tax=unclassified Kineococcus TaxID=2621656 RepID=UPI003D7EABB3
MTATAQSRTFSSNRYVENSLATASPATLLVMLWDRLVLDLQRAETALGEGDRAGAGTQLRHAQDIVVELQSSLKADAWEGGPGLSSLYTWLLQELLGAQLKGDAARITAARTGIVEPLADAWRQAALQHLANGADSAAGGVA